MPNAYLIAALVFVLGLTGAYVKGRHDEGRIAAAEYAQRDLADERANAAAVKGINARYRAKEQAQAQAFAAVSKEYQRRVANAETQKLADAAAVDARTLRLQFTGPTGGQSCGSGAPQAATGAGGRDGSTTTELPGKITADLFALANDADAIVNQLTACQAIVRADRQ